MLVVASGAIAASTSVTLEVADVVPMPITGTFDGKGQTDGMLARVNSLRQEPAGAPAGASRLFLNDLNGPLYILDKANQTFSTYLDFNGRDGHTGLFHKLSFDTGFAGGSRQLPVRSGLRAQWPVLFRPHRGSGAAGFEPARQRACPAG